MPKPTGSCQFGHCLAVVPADRHRYCSSAHERAARSVRTANAAAERARDAVYERISTGDEEPLPARGWFTTTDGVVLDGQAVLELRALITAHRQAMRSLHEEASRPGATSATLVRPLQRLTGEVDARLLATLERLLPATKPFRAGEG